MISSIFLNYGVLGSLGKQLQVATVRILVLARKESWGFGFRE